MIGIAPELMETLRARGHSDADIMRLFGNRPHRGELRVLYDRGGNGNLTSGLPSSRHMYYVQRGWIAVAIVDEPIAQPRERGDVPPSIADHAKADRRAVYRNGSREAIFSMREHASLEAKGWQYVRLASEREQYMETRQGRRLSAEESAIAAALPHDVPQAATAKR
jgi:hypothetical protein